MQQCATQAVPVFLLFVLFRADDEMVFARPRGNRRQHGLSGLIHKRAIGEHIIRVCSETLHAHITTHAMRALDDAHNDQSVRIGSLAHPASLAGGMRSASGQAPF